jgi:hypothetical protein
MATPKALVIENGVTRQIPSTDTLVVGQGISSDVGQPLTITAATGNVTVASPASFSSTVAITGVTTATGAINANGGIQQSVGTTLDIGTAGTTTSIVLGSGSANTTVAGNLTVQGTETVVGATVFDSTVTIGDGTPPDATLDFASNGRLSSVANPNVHFIEEANHILDVAPSVTVNAAGGNLTVAGGNGNGTGGGGNLSLDAGTGTPNGNVNVGATNAVGIVIGHSGSTTTVTGNLTQLTGAVSLTGNAASTFTTTAGLLSLGGAGGTDLSSGGNAALNISNVGPVVTLAVPTGATLGTTGTGMINLPQNFEISGTATAFSTPGTGQVTATNLNTLTAGPASDASSLHTHTGLTASQLSFTSTAGVGGVTLGQLVAIENNAGVPGVIPANAAGPLSTLQNAIGMAAGTAAASAPVSVITNGDISVPDAFWDGGAPAVTTVGERVYASDVTAGNWTLTPTSTSGSTIIRVGIVTQGGAGAVKVSLQIGDGTVL